VALTVAPEETISVPPELAVVETAEPPEETVSVPRTFALVARPPEETKRFAPALTVSPIAVVAEVPPATAQVKT